jgi:eukaryotic-like serine/threonine-protein kinase
LGTTPVPHDHPTAALEGPQPVSPPAFQAGDVLAERFRIVRFIAQGGMGEVYAADDSELGEQVALKTIRPATARDEWALGRFRREVMLARRVTHPNVCRIFDVFHHRGPADAEGGSIDVVFLSMELLAGRTLAEHVRTHGPLPLDQALPLAEQMTAALGAAHEAGVSHRDFKSNNVVLEPTADGGLRVVVTDFGLAGAASEHAQPQDDGGSAMGTPAYMAPEQVEGGVVGPAADIYALGVVLFEMITARLPFMSTNPTATATLRLRESAPSPRRFRPDLDPRWEATILRCLERDPSRRFASAPAVAAALRPPPRATRMRWVWPVLLLTIGALGVWLARRPGPPLSPLKSVQLTNSAGLDIFPSLSPEGERLAYSSDRNGTFEIYLRDLAAGSRDVQLTKDGLQNLQATWSPDGKQIAYHSKTSGGIWLIPAEGGTPRRLTTFGSRPSWSPRGTWIAFQSEGLIDLAANAVAAMPPSTLWRVAPSGGEPVPITAAGDPSGGHGHPDWSPDETRVVFTASDRRSSSVWTTALDRHDLQRLSPLGGSANDPVYAPDGRRIYWSGTNETGSYSLWALALDEAGRGVGTPTQLADFGLGAGRQLSLSRDGSKLAFSSLRMSSNLWSLPIKDGEATGAARPLTSETGRNARAVFSYDGARIAFDKWQSGLNPDVWIMNADGSGAYQATLDPAIDTVPSWDRSGERLVFRSDRGGHPALWQLRVGDGQLERLADMGPDTDWARLAPDGHSFVYHVRSSQGSVNLWRNSLPLGQPQQITFEPEFAGFASLSPDGAWIALQQKRGEDFRVGVIPAAGGTPQTLTLAAGQSWPGSWAPDNDRISFAGFRDGLWNIYWTSRTKRVEHQLTRYAKPNAYVRYPAWSPRGDQIVYEYAETAGNVWLLEGLR